MLTHGGSSPTVKYQARQLDDAVSLGLVPGYSRIALRGFNPDVDTGTLPEYIWPGGAFSWQSAAQSVEVVSSSASDDSAGTGWRTMRITGVDSLYAQVTEIVALDGVGVVACVNQYRHINNIEPVTFGSAGINAGNITVRIAGAGATMGFVADDVGETQTSMWMTPAGMTLLIRNQVFGIARSAGVTVEADFLQEFFRPSGALSRSQHIPITTNGNMPFTLLSETHLPIPEKTGYALKCAYVSASNAQLTGRIQALLVDNSYL